MTVLTKNLTPGAGLMSNAKDQVEKKLNFWLTEIEFLKKLLVEAKSFTNEKQKVEIQALIEQLDAFFQKAKRELELQFSSKPNSTDAVAPLPMEKLEKQYQELKCTIFGQFPSFCSISIW